MGLGLKITETQKIKQNNITDPEVCLLPASMKLCQANLLAYALGKIPDTSQFVTETCGF
jgi:hypothetical protein